MTLYTNKEVPNIDINKLFILVIIRMMIIN